VRERALSDIARTLEGVDAGPAAYAISYSSHPRISAALYGRDGMLLAQRVAADLALPPRWLPEPERLDRRSDHERLLVLPLKFGGTLVVRHHASFDPTVNLGNAFREAGAASWAIVILVLVPGSIVGALTASWLTGRFKRMAAITEGWSRGDFSRRIEDFSDDELSEHADALNAMADRLTDHLQTRQRLVQAEERSRSVCRARRCKTSRGSSARRWRMPASTRRPRA
jgi:HAMP domain-containing protein